MLLRINAGLSTMSVKYIPLSKYAHKMLVQFSQVSDLLFKCVGSNNPSSFECLIIPNVRYPAAGPSRDSKPALIYM